MISRVASAADRCIAPRERIERVFVSRRGKRDAQTGNVREGKGRTPTSFNCAIPTTAAGAGLFSRTTIWQRPTTTAVSGNRASGNPNARCIFHCLARRSSLTDARARERDANQNRVTALFSSYEREMIAARRRLHPSIEFHCYARSTNAPRTEKNSGSDVPTFAILSTAVR